MDIKIYLLLYWYARINFSTTFHTINENVNIKNHQKNHKNIKSTYFRKLEVFITLPIDECNYINNYFPSLGH